MQPNPILTEIRQHREELAREFGYNIRELLRRPPPAARPTPASPTC